MRLCRLKLNVVFLNLKMPVFNKLNSISMSHCTYIVQGLGICIYCAVILLSYISTNNIAESRKTEILNDYYKIILNQSTTKLEYLLHKLPRDEFSNTNISIDRSDIKGCYKQQCVKTNLFEFAASIDENIPNFINYKIEINKQTIHYNTKIGFYELEKVSHINNHNQLSIGISIDHKYWNKVKARIMRPFSLTAAFSTVLLILFVLLNRLVDQLAKSLYRSYFKDHFNIELDKIKETHKNEVLTRENALMTKIWNLEYSMEKDAELNYMFSQEAIQLAQKIQDTECLLNDDDPNFTKGSYKHNPMQHNCKNLPCSIILFIENKTLEKVDIKTLIKIFSNRFVNLNDNIAVSITSSENNVDFVSKASLYQVIYSTISYIIFMLKEQPCTFKYNLKLDILNDNGNLRLIFKYDGLPLYCEEDVFKYSSKFFQKHANPFLLGLNQIFDTLRANNFCCTLGHDKLNFIEITTNEALENLTNIKTNIVKFARKQKN